MITGIGDVITRRLLRLIAREGVSATALFPGYAGAAKFVLERQFWDRQE
jgi:hypothetical protein